MVTHPGEAYFDTSGKRIKEGEASHPVGVPAAIRAAFRLPAAAPRRPAELATLETATACLELHSGSTVIPIQITVDLTSQSHQSPYTILGASLGGDICTSPLASQWQVIESSIGEQFLVLAAQRVPLTPVPPGAALALGTCANGITIIGIYKGPSTYAGIYAFEGEPIWSHFHTTLFKGWQDCS